MAVLHLTGLFLNVNSVSDVVRTGVFSSRLYQVDVEIRSLCGNVNDRDLATPRSASGQSTEWEQTLQASVLSLVESARAVVSRQRPFAEAIPNFASRGRPNGSVLRRAFRHRASDSRVGGDQQRRI